MEQSSDSFIMMKLRMGSPGYAKGASACGR